MTRIICPGLGRLNRRLHLAEKKPTRFAWKLFGAGTVTLPSIHGGLALLLLLSRAGSAVQRANKQVRQ